MNCSLDMKRSFANVGFSDEEQAFAHEFADTEIPATYFSLDMKPSSTTTVTSSYADSPDTIDKETLDTNVSEGNFETASPGSGFGGMQVESPVLISVDVVTKVTQHQREGECGSITQEVGEAERKTVEQNQTTQAMESYSAQSLITVGQSQAKQEVDSFSAQSTEAENKQVLNSTAQNGLLGKSSKPLGGSKGGAKMDVSVKPPWSKVDADLKVTSEPEFTMEATTWPTLVEARDRKPFKQEMPKLVPEPASSKVEDFIPPSTGRKPLQKPPFEIPRHGEYFYSTLSAPKYKSSNKRGDMIGKSNFPASENSPLPTVQNPVPPNQIRRGNAHMGINGSVASSQWLSGNFHNEAWRSPNPINTANGHSNMHAYGRGHPGWHHVDSGYGYGQGVDNRFNCLPPHECHVTPMYAKPFYNIDPAYFNIPNFQMWHAPAGFNYNATNIAPPGPPNGVHNKFEPMSTESSIRRQIEYYFSNENLHEDKYLKSLMDNEGYVPVCLIASFNRMRKLTSSHLVILEALRSSLVVEVKGDKIRRARDWRMFLSSMSSNSETSHLENLNRSGPIFTTHEFQNTRQQSNDAEIRLNEGTSQNPISETAGFQNNGDSCPAYGGTEVMNNHAAGDSSMSQTSSEPSPASVLLNNDPSLIPSTVTEQDNSSSSSLCKGDSDNSHIAVQGKRKDSVEMNEKFC